MSETSTEWELFGFLVLLRAFPEYVRGKTIRVVDGNYNAVRAVRRFMWLAHCSAHHLVHAWAYDTHLFPSTYS